MNALWPHQTRGIDLCRESYARGNRRIVLQLPTGAGKTRCAVEVISRAVERGKRVPFLAHRTELIAQCYKTMRAAGLHVGAISAKLPELADASAPVQVASLQTLLARGSRPPADLIVIDECHHISEGAEYWSSILDAYAGVRVLGLTATPERSDGMGLAPIFEDLIQVIGVRELTEFGTLVPCEVIRPSMYLKQKGVTGNVLAIDPVEAYFKHVDGQQGFVFGATVPECQDYARRLEERGIIARCVHAKTPSDERAAILDGFLAGRVRVLTNVFVFTEGTDLPMASACILARGCGTAGLFLQMVGRVLRAANGKRGATLVDLPGITHIHGMPEDDRVWQLEGRACIRSCMKCRVCSRPLVEYPCVCGAEAPDGSGGADEQAIIANVPLEKYARMIAQGPQQRYETLERWLRIAATKKQNPRAVVHKWKAVYKEPPDRRDYNAIVAALRREGFWKTVDTAYDKEESV